MSNEVAGKKEGGALMCEFLVAEVSAQCSDASTSPLPLPPFGQEKDKLAHKILNPTLVPGVDLLRGILAG